jgi:hypothetical protein
VAAGDFAFVVLSINPFGGLLISIPLAYFQLKYPAWLCVVAGVPLAYVQVVVIDGAWSVLDAQPWWRGFLERRRSKRIEKLVEGGAPFWPTLIIAPLIGPWLVMAFMRYAKIPQRHVALPILLGLGWGALLIMAVCIYAPGMLPK